MPRWPRNGLASAGIGRYGSGLSPPTSSVRRVTRRPPIASAIASYTACCSSTSGARPSVEEEELGADQPGAVGAGGEAARASATEPRLAATANARPVAR